MPACGALLALPSLRATATDVLLARGAGINCGVSSGVSSSLRRDHAGVETDEGVVSHNGLGNRVVLLVSVDTALQDVDGIVTEDSIVGEEAGYVA